MGELEIHNLTRKQALTLLDYLEQHNVFIHPQCRELLNSSRTPVVINGVLLVRRYVKENYPLYQAWITRNKLLGE